jgi:DNA-binding NarL/FixJ family response regulator
MMPPVSHALPVENAVHAVQVIEDLPLVRKLLCDLIEESGRYKVCALSDTETGALADFTAHQPAVVIVDLNLKQGSGLGFIKQVRKLDLPYKPTLIVVTNHGIPALQVACLQAGADHFMDKSKDLPRLRAVIDAALEGGLSP